MGLYETIGHNMGPYRTIQDHTDPKGLLVLIVPYGTVGDHSGPYRTIWDNAGPYGTIQDHTGP